MLQHQQTSQTNNYAILLFDLDETLIDFSLSENKSLQHIHAVFYSSFQYTHFEQAFKVINTNLWKQVGAQHNFLTPSQISTMRFEQLHIQLGIELDYINIANHYENALANSADWLPGVQSAIEFLHKKNYKLGIITNGLAFVQDRKYQRLELEKWFSCFIVSDKVGVSKPHAQIFDLALNAINIPFVQRQSILMIGDSITSDGCGAMNAGIPFCYINPNAMQAEETLEIKYHINSVAHLPKCLGHHDEYQDFLKSCNKL